ncbi:hypothetical protein [Virgisporangium aliadipatigenens]|uniref:hypothetical protein n=1 Tax=Virgisporangium aliadipatigenens TaxID=741659 RepID=UPI001942CDD1|nr:hypothetical protein [Virgisporangium aliadipatigenens]
MGRFDYALDLGAEKDSVTLLAEIETAVSSGAFVSVPVLDDHGCRLTLYLNGALIDSYAVDKGLGPRPTEFS